jgi:hypothetical protein
VYTLAELRTWGRKKGWCPYFLARRMIAYSNVVVYNYQYMIDPKVDRPQGCLGASPPDLFGRHPGVLAPSRPASQPACVLAAAVLAPVLAEPASLARHARPPPVAPDAPRCWVRV